jgi:hypothetical protein
MATLPWKPLARAEPERLYVALLSYLPLKSGWRIPWFMLHSAPITSQLRRSRGLLGYSLHMELMARRFWTLSVWQDEASLHDFVHAQPHARTMTAVAPHMGATRFVRWTIRGAEMPPSWEDALKRWGED